MNTDHPNNNPGNTEEAKVCRHCAAELVSTILPGGNWYPSQQRRNVRWCRACTLRINEENRRIKRLGLRPKPDPAEVMRKRQEALFKQKGNVARFHGIEFDLSFDDVVWPTHCPYLGSTLDYLATGPKATRDLTTIPSFDRIDPSKGYVRGNVEVISYRANAIKRDRSIPDLVRWAEETCARTDELPSNYRTFALATIKKYDGENPRRNDETPCISVINTPSAPSEASILF